MEKQKKRSEWKEHLILVVVGLVAFGVIWLCTSGCKHQKVIHETDVFWKAV